jgi:hypothetical protein
MKKTFKGGKVEYIYFLDPMIKMGSMFPYSFFNLWQHRTHKKICRKGKNMTHSAITYVYVF